MPKSEGWFAKRMRMAQEIAQQQKLVVQQVNHLRDNQ